jgi:hypothetical protein
MNEDNQHAKSKYDRAFFTDHRSQSATLLSQQGIEPPGLDAWAQVQFISTCYGW